ncbi:Na(+)-translocating NADH-quinone reductase subunit A [Aquimarina sp. MMG015]|uniref:Na(+)-translocating NADH-quinone reductase subunit A n=1 Tax=Aquimarina TaxID=290174 RepID=UPI0004230EE5|nr:MULTISPECIES: Na(+)-translocating NADH-quinone reductase subunit A [Aquimarina]AXT58272.1 Na(+)-translocating NADH-quinone reductase subunit A [Aquimarina sp. AD1]MBQ4804899.1 Na(+)-translocating NADH-quinone reductase subunit A [Aquimarina sp. MMG015]RKN36077.1 Na(+)-translocating NADH-quinone reductase subunit A [Aquimarina sp. AD1]
MSKDIRIRKGLDIKLVGEAEKVTAEATKSNVYAIKPDDFHGIVPKVIAKQGTEVKAGEPLFHSKSNENMLFPSPVSGEVVEIVRGAKRKILAFKILADKEQQFTDFGTKDVKSMSGDEIKSHLLSSGCWPFIKQRPYDVIANPDVAPKAIFISAYATAPLAADLAHVLAGKDKELQAAVTALSKLTEGDVHVSVGKKDNSPFNGLDNITLHNVSGPHPAGNVGVQIAKVDPINKGEVVWVVNPQDLVVIGELLLTGKFNAERIIALAGSSIKNPKYFKTKIGAEVSSVIYDSGVKDNNIRVISGNVLTGDNVKPDGHLGFYHDMITVIPEGDDYELFGWNKPIFNKISPSRALTFSWLFPNKKYDLNTNTNGEHRAFVVTGNYETVFPLDIYPLQILKACAVNDLDAMEQLGMYEVAPEDFALTEFICVSKQPHQQIIREGLDLMLKEIG